MTSGAKSRGTIIAKSEMRHDLWIVRLDGAPSMNYLEEIEFEPLQNGIQVLLNML